MLMTAIKMMTMMMMMMTMTTYHHAEANDDDDGHIADGDDVSNNGDSLDD